MAKAEVTRKELLKSPDKFITFSGKLIAFGRSHSKAILIGTGIILALLVVFTGMHYMSDRNEARASEWVENAMAKYSAALGESDAKRAYEQVKADFMVVFETYGSKHAAKLARILFADISYAAGDADTAIAMYSHALEDFGHTPALKPIVLNGLGHAYLLKTDYQQSIRFFEMLTADKESSMQSEARFSLAWLYEAIGDKEKSITMYKQLLADFPDTMYGDLIREKVGG